MAAATVIVGGMSEGDTTSCRMCGVNFRDGDDVVEVDGRTLRVDCAGPLNAEKRRQIGMWAAMGSRGQMGMGAVKRDTPV